MLFANLRFINQIVNRCFPANMAYKVLKMIDDFEEDDDVQNVFHNLEMTKEIVKAMG